MHFNNYDIKLLYDWVARFPLFLYLNALFGRSTENSIYRKKVIASLKLTPNSTVLDVACGIGFNFKILESYLQNSGKIIGIDIFFESLKVAKETNCKTQMDKHRTYKYKHYRLRV